MLAQFTTAPETKFVPLTVRVNAASPAVVEDGDRLVMVGAGDALIVKAAPTELPAGSETVMLAEPALAIRFAGTAAVNCVAFT